MEKQAEKEINEAAAESEGKSIKAKEMENKEDSDDDKDEKKDEKKDKKKDKKKGKKGEGEDGNELKEGATAK